MTHIERIKTVSVVTHFKDFDGDVRAWQEAYFHLLALKDGWGVIRWMDISSNRVNGTFVVLVLDKKEQTERITNIMTDLGYRDIKVYDVIMGEIESDLDVDYFVEA